MAALTARTAIAPENLLPERFAGAVAAGTRYVRHSPAVRRLLLRTLLFVVPGAALWALLPLVASSMLGLDALGYGCCRQLSGLVRSLGPWSSRVSWPGSHRAGS